MIEESVFTEWMEADIQAEIDQLCEVVARAYHEVLTSICDEASIYRAGMIQSVYIVIPDNGCFELVNPTANLPDNLTVEAFEAMLRQLLIARTIVDPHTNEEIWREIPDLAASLPNSRHILGCIPAWSTSENFTMLDEYLDTAPDDRAFVFVVGKFEGTEIEEYIDTYVKASQVNLSDHSTVMRVCNVVARRWNV